MTILYVSIFLENDHDDADNIDKEGPSHTATKHHRNIIFANILYSANRANPERVCLKKTDKVPYEINLLLRE